MIPKLWLLSKRETQFYNGQYYTQQTTTTSNTMQYTLQQKATNKLG